MLRKAQSFTEHSLENTYWNTTCRVTSLQNSFGCSIREGTSEAWLLVRSPRSLLTFAWRMFARDQKWLFQCSHNSFFLWGLEAFLSSFVVLSDITLRECFFCCFHHVRWSTSLFLFLFISPFVRLQDWLAGGHHSLVGIREDLIVENSVHIS